MQGKFLGDVTATANASGSALHYNVTSDFAGSTTRLSGQTDLNGDHQTTATAVISNLPVDRVLAIAAGRSTFHGNPGITAQVSGTLQSPRRTRVSPSPMARLMGAIYTLADGNKLY